MKIPPSAAAFPRSSPTKAVPASSLPGWRQNTRAWAKSAWSYSTVEGVWLCELTLEDGKAAVGEELTELDWSDLVQGGGDSEYLAQCDLPTVVGDTLYFASYDESYERVLVATDLTDGDTDVYYPADLGAEISLDSFCAYKDGQLLVLETEWGEDESAVKLYAIDVENEEATELLTLATGENASATGLAYRADTDTVYCIMDGEICAMTGMDVSTLQRVSEVAHQLYQIPPRPSSPGTVSTSPPTTRRSSAATPTLRSAPRRASPCRTWAPAPLPTPTTPLERPTAKWKWSCSSGRKTWCRR